jgi:hypothetical protein
MTFEGTASVESDAPVRFVSLGIAEGEEADEARHTVVLPSKGDPSPLIGGGCEAPIGASMTFDPGTQIDVTVISQRLQSRHG